MNEIFILIFPCSVLKHSDCLTCFSQPIRMLKDGAALIQAEINFKRLRTALGISCFVSS